LPAKLWVNINFRVKGAEILTMWRREAHSLPTFFSLGVLHDRSCSTARPRLHETSGESFHDLG
jgi:hypothetical protein